MVHARKTNSLLLKNTNKVYFKQILYFINNEKKKQITT